MADPCHLDTIPAGWVRSDGSPDWFGFDRQRYEFTFARREFLGEARTLVFDVQPRTSGIDGFSGRIWIEDRDYNIVRFNGINRDRAILKGVRKKIPFQGDTWRLNVAPHVWLPAYVYSEEIAENDPRAIPRVKNSGEDVGLRLQEAANLTGIHGDTDRRTFGAR